MSNKNNTIPFLSYSIFKQSLTELVIVDKTLINTINQYSFCIAEKDATFKQALQQSDILLPDGVAITAAIRFLYGNKVKKIAGADLHLHFLKELNHNNGSCFYLGASENTLFKIKNKIASEYPNIRVGAYSPAFKPSFSESESQEMIHAVNAFNPDVLFVGMTAPKQEKWSFEYKEQLNAKVICSIGAVFDFYAGTVERPSDFWINLHLEWFIRLIKEPKRMWKRYLYYGPIFIFFILREKWNLILRKINL